MLYKVKNHFTVHLEGVAFGSGSTLELTPEQAELHILRIEPMKTYQVIKDGVIHAGKSLPVDSVIDLTAEQAILHGDAVAPVPEPMEKNDEPAPAEIPPTKTPVPQSSSKTKNSPR
jgi:hypothetical protein